MIRRRNPFDPFGTSGLLSNPITKIQGGVTSEMLRRGLSTSGNRPQAPKQNNEDTTSQPGRQIEAKPAESKDKR